MQLARRTFLAGTLAGIGHVALGARLPARAAEEGAAGFDPYELVPLGKTGLKVSRVGFGTGTHGWGRQSDQLRLGPEKFAALVRGCYDRGIRLFDCADIYGTHASVSAALQGLPRDSYALVTKYWWQKAGAIPEAERPDADAAVERYLREFKTDYIDLVLMHAVTDADWPAKMRKQMDLFAKLKEKGVIRAHGVSCHALPGLQAAAKEPWVDSVHARINPYNVMMDAPLEQVVPALKDIHDAGKGLVGMKIMAEGHIRDDDEKRSRSVEHALRLGCVSAMVVGFMSLAEVDDFAGRVRKVPRA